MSFYKQLEPLFFKYKETTLSHRYITNDHIEGLLENLASTFYISEIGFSVQELPIYAVTIGNGQKKVLMWSQMHGNESTTTKALFDLLNTFEQNELSYLLDACELCIIPILNPDGARAYTRLNANDIDLNRDAQDLSQPESKVLRKIFDAFQPDFCFNLHGQRTIFGAGDSGNPATASFLAPAQDKETTITSTRKIAMSIIVEMKNVLQHYIPDHIGIYDDAFNLNCVGDTFQSTNTPTVLFEAGHYKDDYAREEVRKYMYISMFMALHTIASTDVIGKNYAGYFNIPDNKKLFFDFIIRNAIDAKGNTIDIAIQYQEVLVDQTIEFIPKVEKIGDLSKFFAHNEIDANKNQVLDNSGHSIKVNYENDFVFIDNEKLSLKPMNN